MRTAPPREDQFLFLINCQKSSWFTAHHRRINANNDRMLKISGDLVVEYGDVSVDRSKARLDALGELVSLISVSRSYRELLTVMASESRTALDAATVSLSKFEPEYGRIRTLVNDGVLGPHEEALPAQEVYYLAHAPSAKRMFDEGHAYVQVRDQTDPDDFTQNLLIAEGKQSCLVLPVMFEGRVWGEFWATRTDRQLDFTADDLEYGRLVVAQISGGVAQAEYLARIERFAYTDELTGVANRRMFEEKLDEAIDDTKKLDRVAGLVIADMNGLKRLNDDFGHEVGDNALREFGSFLAHVASTQPGTLAARIGGDEFALLTTGVHRDDVVALAEKLSELAVSGIAEGAAVGVATSADLPGAMLSRMHLMRAADAAQARAKRSRSMTPVLARTTGEAVSLDELDDHETERRRIRGRVSNSPQLLLNRIIARLDDMPDALPRELLSMVAGETATSANAATWWLSRVEPDGETIVTTDHGRARIADDDLPDTYRLADYPLTQQALAGRAVVLEIDDLSSDPAETILMSSIGVSELLMTGGTDRFGTRWLVEIPADSLTYPLAGFANVLRAAVAMALRP